MSYFLKYKDAIHIIKDITDYYNKKDVNNEFMHTKQMTCNEFNITMSTFDKLMYNYPNLFTSHASNRYRSSYNRIEDLDEDDIKLLIIDYNSEDKEGNRLYTNEQICKNHNICIQTLYRLIKLNPDKFIKKKINLVDDGIKDIYICSECKQVINRNDMYKANTGYRVKCICKKCAKNMHNKARRIVNEYSNIKKSN